METERENINVYSPIDGKMHDIGIEYFDVISKMQQSEFTRITDLVVDNIIMRRIIGNRVPYVVFNNEIITQLYWRIYNYIQFTSTRVLHGANPIKVLNFEFNTMLEKDNTIIDLVSRLDAEIGLEKMMVFDADDAKRIKYRINTELNIKPPTEPITSGGY